MFIEISWLNKVQKNEREIQSNLLKKNERFLKLLNNEYSHLF